LPITALAFALLAPFFSPAHAWAQSKAPAAPLKGPAAEPKAPASDAAWVLTFDDEFNAPDIDFTRWTPHDPTGHERHRELQAYLPDNVRFSGGAAHLVARREKATYDGHLRIFTSGTMTSLGLFAQTYGRFEIRCRFPQEPGLAANFSLDPVPTGELPSIEVVTLIGGDPATARFANRWGDEMTERSYDGAYAIGKAPEDFHTFAIEWDAQKVVWLIDGRERFRSIEGIPHQPMYLSLSLAVGGDVAQRPTEETTLPASFDIDYVRVYKRR
jgi:beta-glucanase (GH16 family)